MKKQIKNQYSFDYFVDDLEFGVLGINTHTKGYKLCWKVNKFFKWDFKKIHDHNTEDKSFFPRYRYTDEESEYDLMVNQSSSGYLIPAKKNVNYFLKVTSPFWKNTKNELMQKLSKLPEILLIFELDLMKKNHIERFISNDKKN